VLSREAVLEVSGVDALRDELAGTGQAQTVANIVSTRQYLVWIIWSVHKDARNEVEGRNGRISLINSYRTSGFMTELLSIHDRVILSTEQCAGSWIPEVGVPASEVSQGVLLKEISRCSPFADAAVLCVILLSQEQLNSTPDPDDPTASVK
jgi:hypothetical protein